MLPRRITAFSLVAVWLALLLAPVSAVQASAVALSSEHMAATGGADRPAVTHFPAGVKIVYFDYSVLTPSSSDTVTIEILQGASGKVLVTQSLYVGLADDFYVPLKLGGNDVWPSVGYCTVLLVNGVRQDGNGMPLPWSVGKANAPNCGPGRGPSKLTVRVHTAASVGVRRPVHVLVQSLMRPVKAAKVVLNTRGVGIKKIRTKMTGAKGKAEFKRVEPKKPGAITVVISKPGYITKTVTYRIGH